jgi:uncharacterized protein YjbI with pentapeptide repeats
MFDLLSGVDGLPWLDELTYAARVYSPDDPETGAEVFAALAELAIRDWAPKKRWRLTVPADVKGLRRRWTDEAGKERAEAVMRHFDTPSIGPLAFGEHDGRLDFRGFVDPGDPYGRREAGVLDSVDFSGATMAQVSFNGAIHDSRFDGAVFCEPAFWSCEVLRTSFRGAKLAHAMFWGHEGRAIVENLLSRRITVRDTHAIFRRVDFTGANLGGASANHLARFEDCDFADAWLNNTEFHCDLLRCRFAGQVEGLLVYGRDWAGASSDAHQVGVLIQDLDLSHAHLEFVAFRWVDHSALRLPVGPALRIVDDWPCVHARLEQAIEGMDRAQSLCTRLALTEDADYAVPPRFTNVIEMDRLSHEDGFVEFVRLLDEAEARCKDR